MQMRSALVWGIT